MGMVVEKYMVRGLDDVLGIFFFNYKIFGVCDFVFDEFCNLVFEISGEDGIYIYKACSLFIVLLFFCFFVV